MERGDAYAFSELGIQRITAKNGRKTRDSDTNKIEASNHYKYHIVRIKAVTKENHPVA
jgi:hypothetical protein